MSLGSNGVDRVLLLRKIPMQLRGTNFCTSSARFSPSFVRQPNGTKCTQIVRNATKHEFRDQWGGSVAFVVKNSDATSWHKLLHCSARFAPSFVRQPNCPKCTQMVQNSPKHEFWSNGVDRVLLLRKIPMRHRRTNFCTRSACFAPSFVREPNGTKLSKA